MAAIKVYAPVKSYTGKTAGVAFTDGVATTDTANAGALAYFRRHGYGIGAKPVAEVAEPADPRDVGFLGSGITKLGTPLRDAAVDPRPGDYLAPTNAGQANPHGPLVVSPEIHGAQGVRPVKPGEVSDEPEVQESAEEAHTEALQDIPLEQPARNASKEAWVTYAIAQGADPDDAAAAKRDELVELYYVEDEV